MKKVKDYFFILFMALALLGGLFILFIYLFNQQEVSQAPLLPAFEKMAMDSQNAPEIDEALEPVLAVKHIDAPEEVKALYFTALSAGRKGFVEKVLGLASTTDINAVVIDLKDMQGRVAYDSQLEQVEIYNSKRVIIKEIDKLIEALHQENIYLIGRLCVFQDNALAKALPNLALWSRQALPADFKEKEPEPSWFWLDNMGLAWIDPSFEETAIYNSAIAREAISLGFDEINFDYIRFPTGGNMEDIFYPIYSTSTAKHLIIKDFFEKIRQELPEAKLSADIFAFSLIKENDLEVGQLLEDILPYFDYVCPMVYPSHFSLGFMGYPEPARYPYEVVKRTMEKGQARRLTLQEKFETASSTASSSQSVGIKLGQFRPWLQDFDLFGVSYNEKEVKAEIKAVKDVLENDFKGFMLWNASNIYTESAVSATTTDVK